MREINEIIVHCSVTKADWLADKTTADRWAEIKRWHLARKFNDIGYHFGIDRSGEVIAGRSVAKSGAHCRGHNRNSIGICLFGAGEEGVKRDDPFLKNFTPEQDTALHKRIADLRATYPSITVVSGHNAYAAKACPCFNVPEWLSEKSKVPSFWSQIAAFFRRMR